ncbi:MAG: glycosyltransferase [Chloroflexaceae bacterium]|nr:glycosyltransferase [Chloroflexaceae bacterium]
MPSGNHSDLMILSALHPYPPQAGGTRHMLDSIAQLSRFYAIDLCILQDPAVPLVWGPLTDWCRSCHAFERTPRRLSPWLPPAVSLEYSAPLCQHVQQAWAIRSPRMVQIEYTSMLQYAPLARRTGATVICTAYVIAFVAQVRRAQRETDHRRRARRWLGAMALWWYELRMLPLCDLVMTLSAYDAIVLRRWLPRLPVFAAGAGMNLDDHPVCFNPQAQHEVLFVGSYQHPPNVEGALWLAQEVWPLVQQACPDARLTLAGKSPPAALQALASEHVRVPGTLDDVRPCYERASLFAAPIFWGSGVRIKILEALAYGMPLVTTPMAAEGINLVDQKHALFAQQPGEFAAAIVQLLQDAPLRERLSRAGRALIEQQHNWQRLGEQLIARYEQAHAGRLR